MRGVRDVRVAVVLTWLLVGALSGCLGMDGSPGAGARLEVSGFRYEDRPCNDEVPVWFTVRNVGDAAARDVVAYARGGYGSETTRLGDVGPGVAVPVNLTVAHPDNCGEEDAYTETVIVIHDAGPDVWRDFNITI